MLQLKCSISLFPVIPHLLDPEPPRFLARKQAFSDKTKPNQKEPELKVEGRIQDWGSGMSPAGRLAETWALLPWEDAASSELHILLTGLGHQGLPVHTCLGHCLVPQWREMRASCLAVRTAGTSPDHRQRDTLATGQPSLPVCGRVFAVHNKCVITRSLYITSILSAPHPLPS